MFNRRFGDAREYYASVASAAFVARATNSLGFLLLETRYRGRRSIKRNRIPGERKGCLKREERPKRKSAGSGRGGGGGHFEGPRGGTRGPPFASISFVGSSRDCLSLSRGALLSVRAQDRENRGRKSSFAEYPVRERRAPGFSGESPLFRVALLCGTGADANRPDRTRGPRVSRGFAQRLEPCAIFNGAVGSAFHLLFRVV